MRISIGVGAGLLVLLLAACEARLPDLRDSKLFDRRIEETPRQKVVRECRQEGDRFRVSCTHCHSTSEEEKIHPPDALQLTAIGKRAQIMRLSPTFGLHKQCSECHQSKFKLNASAEALFGPSGTRRQDIEKEILQQPVR